ncbi:MAG: ribosome silencing factor [Schleiferiaceae bacterium]|jgi:ribosome-associated protein|nr:ribosome silencing factor [Schleiferiaceae bacterium]MDP4627699.1 ribosome silencing factor [Schleiferiaceae bacterium]MDP4728017.1 ribosome silencing factor [Schleiferiaceae bacterium]MDP4750463.1 ribosome silencing factor [Schleiferiaceae bacterium]MDP4858681.1 ribosome silencing factor [Schleiferiaceae bacterium]
MPKKAAVKTAYPPLVHAILDGLSDLKAENATVIDLRDLENAVSSFFIIADAQSNTQVNAMSQAVRKQAREQCAERPWHVEGEDNSEWILLDYVSTVVHLFQTPARAFYDLEGLWGDGKVQVIDLEALAKAQADAEKALKKAAAPKTSAKTAVKTAKVAVKATVKTPAKAAAKTAKVAVKATVKTPAKAAAKIPAAKKEPVVKKLPAASAAATATKAKAATKPKAAAKIKTLDAVKSATKK